MKLFSCVTRAMLASSVALLLSGCGSHFKAIDLLALKTTGIHGTAYGGRQPIVGAHIYLMQAGVTAYAGPGIAAATNNTSTSLLTSGDGYDGANYYVVTDSDGGFSVSSRYTCTSGYQVYLYSVGGKPDGVHDNSAAGLMAVLGTCGSSFDSSTNVNMNEVSTVAAAYAIAGFASDATHVSTSGSALAQSDIQNAFANANLLFDTFGNPYDGSSGTNARTSTPNGNGIVPQQQIDTLANILAACIDTTSSSSSQCTTLFTKVLSNGVTGDQATDTATEAIYIAHNPGVNVDPIYKVTGIGAPNPYTPWFNGSAGNPEPADFVIALKFSGGGIANPSGVAIDDTGSVWLSNYNASTVSKLSPLGIPTSPAGGWSGGGITSPQAIAVDASGNAWVANSTNSVSRFSRTGTAASPDTTGYTGGGLAAPYSIAIDGPGHAWITNTTDPNGLTELDTDGTPKSPSNGYTAGGVNHPEGIAVDANNHVWYVNYYSGTASEIDSTGAAVSPSGGYTAGSLNNPIAIAIDHTGNAWIANYYGQSVSELSSTGALVGSGPITGGGLNLPAAIAIDGSGNAWLPNDGGTLGVTEVSGATATGYISANLTYPSGVAVDGAGNVWIADQGSAVVELIGAATPVVTPLAAGVANNQLGARP